MINLFLINCNTSELSLARNVQRDDSQYGGNYTTPIATITQGTRRKEQNTAEATTTSDPGEYCYAFERDS